MSTNTSPETSLLIPDTEIARALEVANDVPVASLAFSILNFAESELWIKLLHLINDHGIPQNADPETRAWSVNSFRLLEDTLQARKLREGLINRPACIEINRKAGSVELVLSLRQLYLLLQAFQDRKSTRLNSSHWE